MKTNQFIKEIKSMGFRAKDVDTAIIIIDSNDLFVAKVSKVSVGKVTTDYPGFTNLEYGIKLNFLDFLFSYSAMPIEDREEEEKYYYCLKGFGEESYLNRMDDGEDIFLSDYLQFEDCQTQFTDAEFEALPEDVKSHNWEKIKVESED